MKTETNTTARLEHRILKVKGKEKTVIKIKLHDDCNNGHEDFSVTCDIYEKTPRGWRDMGGGAAHEHILNLCHELKPFVDLHLCDVHGAPMHGVANGLYWFAGMFPDGLGQKYHGGSGNGGKTPEQCREIFAEHFHLSPEQVEEFIRLKPTTGELLAYYAEQMGLRKQWQALADAAIHQLEEWTGKRFESQAVKQNWPRMKPEKVAEIESRIASGYYTPEQVETRLQADREAAIEAKRAEIESKYAEALEDADWVRRRELEFLRVCGLRKPNVIYYSHVNTLSANWTSTEKLVTADEWEAFTREINTSEFPPGMKFEFRERPKF